jgi:hypothetical protein
MAKQVFPSWFDPHRPPRFMQGEPKEMYLKNAEKSRIYLDDGDEITFDPSLTYKVDKDFSGCYYPGDEPTIYLIGYLLEDTPNPNYKKEMKVYNTNLKKHQEILAEWERLKVLWDEKIAKEAVAKEKALLKKLKAKYE